MKTVNCPTCGKPALFEPSNKYRPFCRERCATLDLGAWADEKFRVPAFEQETESVNENSECETAPLKELPPRDHRN